MSDLLQLADRVEALDGPDRNVDYEIFLATAEKEAANYWNPERGHQFTSAIKDASSLIPISHWCDSGHTGSKHWACVTSRISFKDYAAKAATTPLAICAAALRAQAEKGR